MKVSEFTKILRKVIREEVRAAIKQELKEASKSKKENPRKIINHGLDLHESVEKFEKKSYSSNPLLNDILNETAQTGEPIPTMNATAYTSGDARGGIRSKFQDAMNPDVDFGSSNAKPTAAEMIPDDKKHVQVPDYVTNALTKDYSGLVKAFDKKKK